MFIMVGLSLAVSILDGFGLTMFLPLLQMVSGDGNINPEQLGSLSFIVDGMEYIGVSMTLTSVLLFMILFFVLKGMATYLNSLYNVIIEQYFIRTLRLRLLNQFNKISFNYFINTDAGRIQNTLSGEVNAVSSAFRSYFRTLQQGVMVAVYLGFAFILDPQFAVLISIGGLLTNFLFRIIYKHTKTASRRFTRSSHGYQGLLIQHVANFKYLRATGSVNKHSHRLKEQIVEIEKSRRKIGILAGISAAAREPLLVMVVASVILIQVYLLGGSMSAILLSLLFFYRALSSLVLMQEQWNSFMGVAGSMENMEAFEKEIQTAQETNGKEIFKNFDKEIVLQDLHFSFGDTPIIRGIDLNISKNQSVAFVGESGSGKTTLVNLISGLLEAESGEISIDGNNVQDLNKTSYQSRLGYITQEAVIFNDTIFNNVSFWDEPTPENIDRFNKALEQAAILDFVKELPEQEHTLLGNNGINLSGGQRQRISIARELYKDIDILIMDEATSALDSETEKAIQESIEALHGKYTLIIIAHRLSTIRNVDKVIFMHKGKIINQGNFEEVIENSDAFKRMVELQEL